MRAVSPVLEAESQLRFFQQLVDLGEGRQFEEPRAENAFREVDHHLIVGVGPDGRAPFVYQPVVGQVRPQQQDFHAADAAEMASDVLDAVVHADEHQLVFEVDMPRDMDVVKKLFLDVVERFYQRDLFVFRFHGADGWL